MNNYLLSKQEARVVERTPLQTAARHIHATELPFRNTEGRDAKLVKGNKQKVNWTAFTEKYQALTDLQDEP